MENKLVLSDLKSDLISLGFSFYGDPSECPVDPEMTLIRALALYYNDRKVFRMLLRWCLVISPLLHVERIHKFSTRIDSRLVPVLGALSSKLILSGDRRFKLVRTDMKNRMNKTRIKIPIPDGYDDPFLCSKYGMDQEFGEFKIAIAKLEPADENKVLPLSGIVKIHQWLRLRTLIGANFRADLIYWLIEGSIKNSNQAAKVIGCSRETAYRLWKEVSLFENLNRVVT